MENLDVLILMEHGYSQEDATRILTYTNEEVRTMPPYQQHAVFTAYQIIDSEKPTPD